MQGRPDGLIIRSANQVPPSGNAGDVGVDRERRMAGGHREDDVGRLGSHTGEGHQFLPRAVGRQLENPF